MEENLEGLELFNNFIKNTHIKMTLESPEGDDGLELECVPGLKNIVQLFIVISAIFPICEDIYKELPEDGKSYYDHLRETVLETIESDMREVANENQ